MNDYYVYKHIRKDSNTVFYVGKGCKDRAYNLKLRNKYHSRIVKKHGCIIEIVLSNLSQEEAFKKEIELISNYKAMGQCEANLTLGGEGCLGREVKKSTRSKIAKKLLGTKLLEETKIKISQSRLGISSGMLGKTHKIESNLLRSKSLKLSNKVKRKSIVCLNTGIIYKSLDEAVKALNLNGTSNLSKVLKGQRSHINGYNFKYTEDLNE